MNRVPRLAVFQDEHSAPVLALSEASQDVCRIVWVVGWSPHETALRPLRRFGEVVDLTGLSVEDSVKRVVAAEPDGVVVFTDGPIRLAAAVAGEEPNLPFIAPR